MLDLGWQELFLITLVALVVVGPKDLPTLIRSISRWMRTARGMVRELHNTFEDVARETELEAIRNESLNVLKENLFDETSSEQYRKPLADVHHEENITDHEETFIENEDIDGLMAPTKQSKTKITVQPSKKLTK